LILFSKTKTTIFITRGITLPLCFISSFSFAEQAERTVVESIYLTTQVGFFKVNHEPQQTDSTYSQISSSSSFGFGLGYNLFENTDLRINYNKLSFDINDTTKSTIKADSISTDLIQFIADRTIYISSGISQLNIGEKAISLNIGNGFNYKINQRLSWFIESKLGFNLSSKDSEFSINSGLNFKFSGEKQAIVPTQVIDAELTSINSIAVADISPQPVAVTEPVAYVSPQPVAVAEPVAYVSPQPVAVAEPIAYVSPPPAAVNTNKDCLNFVNVSTVQHCSQLKSILAGTKKYIYFTKNQTNILPFYYEQIDKLARVLKRYPSKRAVISGHTSEIGTAADNLLLSLSRAHALREYLTTKHALINNRFIIKSYGEAQLLNKQHSIESDTYNRRVEYHIID